jgi:hypothetical protein
VSGARTIKLPRWPLASLASAARADKPVQDEWAPAAPDQHEGQTSAAQGKTDPQP